MKIYLKGYKDSRHYSFRQTEIRKVGESLIVCGLWFVKSVCY